MSDQTAELPAVFVPVDELDLNTEIPTLVQDLIPKVGVGVLYSEPELGKSPVALDCAFSIAERGEWLGRKVNFPGDVVFIPLEGVAALHGYIRGQRREHGPRRVSSPGRVYMFEPDDPRYDHKFTPLVVNNSESRTSNYVPLGAASIICHLASQEIRPALIILDTQVDFMDPDQDENGSGMVRMYQAAMDMAHELGCFVLFVHHTNRTTETTGKASFRGSGAIRGKADVEIALERLANPVRGEGTLMFKKRKGLPGAHPVHRYWRSVDEKDADYCVSWEAPQKTLSEAAAEYEASPDGIKARTTANTREVLLRILADAPEGLTQNLLRKELKAVKEDGYDVYHSTTAVPPILDIMRAAGEIRSTEGARSSVTWSLVTDSVD